MSTHRLDATALLALRTHLAQHRDLLQVRPDSEGNLRWLNADAHAPLPERALLPAFSAKALLFSERENLFAFDGRVFREQRPVRRASVLFGVSACDLAAIHYQDRFFADDPWYQARRSALLLVGIDCTSPCDGGFCPLTDSGPFVRESHADLVLHRQANANGDDDWLLFVGSERGAQALAGFHLPHHVGTHRQPFVAQHEPAVVTQFPPDNGLRAGIAALNDGKVPHAQWQRLGVECITCSGCSNVCPTCSCFATRQEMPATDQSGHESSVSTETTPINTVRFWDSCLFEGFQREASGHNPSVQPGARIERYWTHKFGNAFAARFGHYTCVGCGRCDRVCPSGIGARATLQRIGTASACTTPSVKPAAPSHASLVNSPTGSSS